MAHLKMGGGDLFFQLSMLDEQRQADEDKTLNIETALTWQESRLKYLRMALHYRETVLKGNQAVTLNKKGRAVWLPGTLPLRNEIKIATQIVQTLREIVDDHAKERIYSANLSDGNFLAHPSGVKMRARYSLEGVFIWDWCYQYEPDRTEYFGNKYVAIKMHSDATGFWFVDGKRKNYVITHRSTDPDSSDSLTEDATVPTTTDPTDSTTTQPQAGSSKQLLPKKGHGLARLVAEAKDPPGIEFSGNYESLKGFRRRLLARKKTSGHQLDQFIDVTSIFKWDSQSTDPDCPSCCIITFDSLELREIFVRDQPIPPGLKLRPLAIN